MDLPNLTPLEVEILRRTADISSISYDATPTRDADASNATDSDDSSLSSMSTPEEEDEPDDATQRLGNTNCCCVRMETVAECVCCREYPAAVRKQQGRQSCVTSHPDFEGLCLNPGVLQLALLNMRHYAGTKGTGGQRQHEPALHRRLMVPIFMEFDDHKFIADLMAELDVYARASGTLEAYMTERILPLAWQASARRCLELGFTWQVKGPWGPSRGNLAEPGPPCLHEFPFGRPREDGIHERQKEDALVGHCHLVVGSALLVVGRHFLD
ncbi:hypothetical protein HPB47_017980 [Ixodes persulcatus]|uniref:Uncharacterized protein n=1 Tax=Ixodes persulcatus TaxID=34615 RepID=A0AC60QLV3_IXOPE|nr:hypothetical protein HPB47_017980 [Ixodes persulcatus]